MQELLPKHVLKRCLHLIRPLFPADHHEDYNKCYAKAMASASASAKGGKAKAAAEAAAKAKCGGGGSAKAKASASASAISSGRRMLLGEQICATKVVGVVGLERLVT